MASLLVPTHAFIEFIKHDLSVCNLTLAKSVRCRLLGKSLRKLFILSAKALPGIEQPFKVNDPFSCLHHLLEGFFITCGCIVKTCPGASLNCKGDAGKQAYPKEICHH